MPFDFKKYDAKCAEMNPEELQKEWEHYTRLISGAATSTTVSGLALPFTAGVSVIGVGMAAPAIHNARKKREIIEKHLVARGTTHNTRAKDVLGSMAFSGTLGVLTLGVGSMGADAVAQQGAEHGISAIVNNDTAIKVGIHAALDGAAMAGEEAHHNHKKEKEANKMIAAAKAKIAAAQAQGLSQYQAQPMGEKPYGYQGYPAEATYGAVQIPGAYNGQQAVPPPPQYPQDIKYPVPQTTEVKHEIPPTPQYTPAPPAYSSPPPVAALMPQYNPQNFAPTPAQTPGPMSPAPSVSTISSYSSLPSQVFSPATSVASSASTPYSPPPTASSDQPQAAAQNLPPFQSHVAAPGCPAPKSQLVWSQAHNQWVSQEVSAAPRQPASAPVQTTPAPQEYPFPPQPIDRRISTPTVPSSQYGHAADRRASVYAPTPTAANQYSQPPTQQQVPATPGPEQYSQSQQYAPQQPPAPSSAAPTPTSSTGYASPSQAYQQPAVQAYGYPTPAQTPGTSQIPQAQVPYFPPPPGVQGASAISTYTPAPPQQAPPQYALVSTPQPYAPHRHSVSQYPVSIMTPPPEPQPQAQAYHYAQPQAGYQHTQSPRHHSLPNATPIPGQEKLGYGWQPTLQGHAEAPSPQVYHAPQHSASWGAPLPTQTPMSTGGYVPQPPAQPQPQMQGLVDVYGGMKI